MRCPPELRTRIAFIMDQAKTPGTDAQPRLYTDLADWWQVLSAPEDYEEEASWYQRVLLEAAGSERIDTLLELGSGGGNNASYLKKRFAMVLVDRSPDMLRVSHGLNPECEHVEGDMRTVRLGRQFDAVFVHDAIVYMTTEADLAAAIRTAFVHCRPGGVALFCPDALRETFSPSTECGGHDGEARALRYLEWNWDPDPADTTCIADYVYVLRDQDGSVRVVHDRHVEGLFARADWMRLLADAGFQARSLPLEHSEVPPGQVEIFVARRPAETA